jgi:hypothetical protein
VKSSFSQVGPKQFDRVLDMVSKVRSMGMEVCTTLGMLNTEQAQKLKVAGLSCYNHNLDTSPEFYPKITSSRNYDDRLDTLEKVMMMLTRSLHHTSPTSADCPVCDMHDIKRQDLGSHAWQLYHATMITKPCAGVLTSFKLFAHGFF